MARRQRRRVSAPPTKGQGRPAPRVRTRSCSEAALTEWEDQSAKIFESFKSRPKDPKDTAAYFKRENIYKRGCYNLIRNTIKDENGIVIRVALENFGREPKSPSFKENPFYWGLAAIELEDDKPNYSRLYRFSRQLLYAHKHDIDPELLIGFLLQTGTPDAICRKAGAGTMEPWYHAYMERKKGDAQRLATVLSRDDW